jgi:hypothetical protein
MLLSLTACVGSLGGYGPNHLSKDEYIRYVEGVFKLQNSVTSQIMVMQENGDIPKDQETLWQAEQNMNKICAPLNNYVALELDGQSAGLLLQQRVEKSATDCEMAAKVVKSLLAK